MYRGYKNTNNLFTDHIQSVGDVIKDDRNITGNEYCQLMGIRH